MRPARYGANEHLPKWMLKKAATASEIWAASPYVTDHRLFNSIDQASARLYMDFTALHFISGASSLPVLMKLLSAGVKVFHVPNIHAKVVMINGQYFSIGSQNLTLRGQRTNVEASFIAGSDTPAHEIRFFFDNIHKYAIPVSKQDVQEMTRMVKPLLPIFKDLRQLSEQVDKDVQQAREERDLAERRRVEEERERIRAALSKIRRFLSRSKLTPSNHLLATVRELHRPVYDLGMSDGSTDSLVPVHSNRDFEGLLTAIDVWPQRLSRYLIIHADSGKLGLVRFAKTRWTFFGERLISSEKLIVGDRFWKVELEFAVDLTHIPPRNGLARLKSLEFPSQELSIGFLFSVEGIEVEEVAIPSRFLWRSEIDLELTREALSEFLLQVLTTPFKFAENLYGQQAHTFFGASHPTFYHIQAHRIGKTAIFSARQV